MGNMSQSTHRPTVALSLPKKVPALIVYAQGIVERLTSRAAVWPRWEVHARPRYSHSSRDRSISA
jgi:hypothetical protein